jgi:Flp pilus assembly protein TadD
MISVFWSRLVGVIFVTMVSTDNIRRPAVAATLGLVLLAVYVASGSLWGLEHFKYNAPYGWFLLGFLIATSLYCAYGPLPTKPLERGIEKTSRFIWGRSHIPRIVISLCSAALFFLFRVETAFLGDGYLLLNTFGRDEAYSSHAIKPLSIGIIKLVQSAFGGYTYWTSLYAFQTISIVSGAIVVYNFIAIAGLLAQSARGRLLAFGTLVFSGWILLFFGYLEYYPMLWMAASFFVRFALSYLKGGASYCSVVLSFLSAIAIHMEAIFFLPGLLYLTAYRFAPQKTEQISPRTSLLLMIAMIAAVPVVVFAVGELVSAVDNPYLPLIGSDLTFPRYAVLSLDNMREIANQILLCLPAVIVLLALAYTGPRRKPDSISRLLTLLSFGSLAFLLTVEPKLGMARDFDLMTLTLFAPLLMLLYRIGSNEDLPVRPILIAIVISLTATVSFLGANCTRQTSIERAHDLLRHYGTRDKQGWLSFGRFAQAEGQTALANEVAIEINGLFPEQARYKTVMSLISRGKLADAEILVQGLIKLQPENGEYLAALGDIRVGQNAFTDAVDLYRRALHTHPNHRVYTGLGRAYSLMGDFSQAIEALAKASKLSPGNETILTELCRAYRQSGQIAGAGNAAAALLEVNRRSPEGHLVSMLIAIQADRKPEARSHYGEFLQYGTAYPEYETIREKYAWLLGSGG